ncbi:CPBP family intramembrane glutamic endopeptidase [Bacillus sp. CGMCC 1.16607]|uniref:CPBP family intramembrane glutamic endopeptidase n=1 Tax=Bacillus sp. CGMCC 1.16607 TaxID=3351842 RepID=UPI0036415A50
MKKNIFVGIIGFIFLDLYFNLLPVQLSNSYIQLATILLFFPLAHILSKFVGLNGLSGIGVHFHSGWARNFILSFLIGFSFWVLLNGYYFLIGEYTFVGVNKRFFGMPLLEVIVGYLLGSIINDIMIRGYLITLLKDKLSMKWVLSISITVYALEDFWYAGFSLDNIIFSIVLGFSLTYAFYKTGSIWANTGIHFGLNMVYGLLFGQMGKPNSSLLIINESSKEFLLSQIVDLAVPFMMFLFMLWAIRFYKKTNENKSDLQLVSIVNQN